MKMTDDELIAALREEDAYNERFYEPDPLHKLSADRIEALVKERDIPSWQEEAAHQNALLHQALSRADRLEAALREIDSITVRHGANVLQWGAALAEAQEAARAALKGEQQ